MYYSMITVSLKPMVYHFIITGYWYLNTITAIAGNSKNLRPDQWYPASGNLSGSNIPRVDSSR